MPPQGVETETAAKRFFGGGLHENGIHCSVDREGRSSGVRSSGRRKPARELVREVVEGQAAG